MNKMNVQRTGIILNTENYEACVAFYKTLFDLPVMYEKVDGDFKLTCLEFGGAYLMIETEGFGKPTGKTVAESPAKLRFNVDNITEALKKVQAYGIDAEINTFSWGSTINIFDPDGNRVGIRDDSSFDE